MGVRVGDDGVDLRIWGKQKGLTDPYPLAWHLADTAAVAQRLWERYLSWPASKDRLVSRDR